jgi:hypothetical protein
MTSTRLPVAIGTTRAAAAALLLVVAAPALAAAQDGTERTAGFQLAAYVSGTGAMYEGADEADSGAGLTVRLGYGFTGRIAAYASASGASMESGDYTLAHADLGARFLLTDRRLRPYVQAALSGRAASIRIFDEVFEMRGVGPTVGGGFEYGVGRSAALDVGMSYTFGKFTETRFGGGPWEKIGSDAPGSSTVRLDVGMMWRP